MQNIRYIFTLIIAAGRIKPAFAYSVHNFDIKDLENYFIV